jgi:AGCS family alanine or glycine:cation symporter
LAGKTDLEKFSGQLTVTDGKIKNQPSIVHCRSLAEDVTVQSSGKPFSGTINVQNGRVLETSNVTFSGKSLVHSAPLTTEAFTKSWLGDYGRYIVAIGLLLFAFSTAISWSYYGGRAITFLFGVKADLYFRIV